MAIGSRTVNAMLNNASFRIDRISGRLTSSGGFQGDCEPEDVTRRKF